MLIEIWNVINYLYSRKISIQPILHLAVQEQPAYIEI